MKLKQNLEEQARIYDVLRSQEVSRTAVWHASDLLQPRKAYWQRTMPKPATDEELGFWLAGRAHHFFMVAAMTGVQDSQEASLLDSDTGISFSPDFLKLKGEFKTTAWSSIPASEAKAKQTFSEYIKQCKIYATLLNSVTFKLYVFFLAAKEGGRTTRKLRVYDLLFTEKELAKSRRDLKAGVAKLDACMAAKDHTSLPLCSEFMCHRIDRVTKAITPVCKWFEACKPGARWKNWIKQEGASKHV